MRAIREHGAGVGMDDIAAAAGTSKTVVYRHFTDRAGLYAAVAERVDATIMHNLSAAIGEDSRRGRPQDGRTIIAAAIDAYLRLVQDEPEIYRFVVAAPILERPGADHSGAVSAHIAEQLVAVLESSLRADGPRAQVWAHGVVGMVRAAADDWLTRGAADSGLTREALTALLTDLAWSGLSPAWT